MVHALIFIGLSSISQKQGSVKFHHCCLSPGADAAHTQCVRVVDGRQLLAGADVHASMPSEYTVFQVTNCCFSWMLHPDMLHAGQS